MGNRIIILLFFSLLLAPDIVCAQEINKRVHPYPLKHAIKYDPLATVNYTPALQFGYEHKMATNKSVCIDIGFIVDAYKATSNGFQGLRIRPGYRFYKKQKRYRALKWFLGPTATYKLVHAKGSRFVPVRNNSYSKIQNIHVFSHLVAAYGEGGFVFPFSEHFYGEIALALGARAVWAKSRQLPRDNTQRVGNDFFSIFPIINGSPRGFLDSYLNLKIIYAW